MPIVKTNSEILLGREYRIIKFDETVLHFERLSTKKYWSMELKDIFRAYQELEDFKTINFKPYVRRTHSALGILLTLSLLTKKSI